MADEDPGRELPQRVRGAARTGPPTRAQSSSPVLSEELRQRIQAAVTAERSGAAATEQDAAPDAETTSSEPVRPAPPKLPARSKPSAASKPPVPLKPPALSKPPGPSKPSVPSAPPARPANASLPAEDEVTQWLGVTAKRPAGGAPPARAGSARPAGRSAARRTGRVAIIALVIGVLAVTAVRYFGRPAGPGDAATRRAAAAARGAAATWVARQVSRDVKVSCDQVMCAALRTRGFPPGELLVLTPTSEVPTSSAVVVETPDVLGLFGSSLANAWAPAVLASFGSGPSLVTVRVIAPNGAAAYQTRLSADLADRKTAGAALLNDAQITVTPRASQQLTAGAIDSRLLLALAALAGHQPISIVRFGNPGTGASRGVPLRYADLDERYRGRRLPFAAYVRAVRAYLGTLAVTLRPARMMTGVPAGGRAVLRIEFAAPSPLGVFGASSIP
jgi:hypothetical protein